jgi:hypothetical protein
MERATSQLKAACANYFLLLFCLILLPCASVSGQSNPAKISVYPPPANSAQTKVMTVDDVIRLSKSGLSDDVIIKQIRKKGQSFDLTTDQLVQLKSASVSERVIQVMIDPTSDAAASPKEKAVTPAPSQAGQVSIQDSGLPTEIGVYAKEKGKWTEVLPEVVNWKTGGVVKNVATVGIVKGDINGHVNGANSRNRFGTPIEFLIVVPEGVAITEWQMLRLHPHGDNREFRTVTGGVFHVSGGATRDLMPFDGKKVAARTYSVSFSPGSGAGEFGFLPPGAFTSMNTASAGKLYSFRVIE